MNVIKVHIIIMGTDSEFRMREARAGDRKAIAALLAGLESKYPGGEAWFESRYDDVLLRRALCYVAESPRGLAGTAIITPKGAGRSKLSTLKVAPWARRQGVARALLDLTASTWLVGKVRAASVTVDDADCSTKSFFAAQPDFLLNSHHSDRYGRGRDEAVFAWSPDASDNALSAHLH